MGACRLARLSALCSRMKICLGGSFPGLKTGRMELRLAEWGVVGFIA